jgi:hypothetical protein
METMTFSMVAIQSLNVISSYPMQLKLYLQVG